tara:strand:- start:771 stop:1934 length:1164 start_codon:yes stop_codon:yes gene_type:complete
MNRLLAENLTTGKYELVTSTDGALNTTGGGADVDGNSIIKGVTDIDDPTNTVKNIKVTSGGAIKTNSELQTSGNGTNISNGLQVLTYGKDSLNANIHALHMNGDDLLVKNATLNTALTDGSQLTKVQGNSQADGSGTNNNILVTAAGACLTINEGGNIRIDSKTDSGTGKDIRCDGNGRLYAGVIGYTDITDDTTAIRIKSSATGSLSVKQDDHASVTVQGVSDQGNPFGTKKPLLINTDGKLLVNSQLKGNDGDDGAGTNRTIQCDATGKLEVVSIPNISRGQIGGFTDGAGTGWNANGLSNAIDMTYHKTIEFHIQSSATGSHNIQILVSNDNVTYVVHQQFALQTVGTDEIFKGSLTAGFRYVKLKNVGSDISTTTYKQYALYN